MPSAPFPARPDSGKLFARNGVIDATLPLSRLPRFAGSLHDEQGEVAVHLAFGHDAEGRRQLRGTLTVTVCVLCQRCLQPMDLQLEAGMDLVVVDDEAVREALEAGNAEVDVLVDAEDDLDVLALIEDELLLSLPSVPMHADLGCNQALVRLRQHAAAEQQETAHPFAALAALKRADPGCDGGKGKG